MADAIPTEMVPEHLETLRVLVHTTAEQLAALRRVLLAKGLVTQEELDRLA